MTPRVAFILGTRPEIIKLAPVIHACRDADVPFTIVHTGQHYSETLDGVFFEQLELPDPDVNLEVGSGSHGRQTGEMLSRVERALTDVGAETVLVQGDTNTVLAGALAAAKMDAELGHVEAGLRSGDRTMPEETNRVVADHVADYLFAPTDDSRRNLRTEGIPDDRITVTGNTVVDAVQRNIEIARRRSDVLRDLGLRGTEFVLVTAHRAGNVDDPDRFRAILQGIDDAARAADAAAVYPMHPRAAARLEEFGLAVPDRIRTVEPLEYLDFLRLEASASLILTDSGGVQEEACILGVPCVTMRDSTERPETIEVGANTLRTPDADAIRRGAREMLGRESGWSNPYGDGTASERILAALGVDIGVVAR
jgi:UDP-N-acetylglucosamine 2-epimerase (non-hydrolysing)